MTRCAQRYERKYIVVVQVGQALQQVKYKRVQYLCDHAEGKVCMGTGIVGTDRWAQFKQKRGCSRLGRELEADDVSNKRGCLDKGVGVLASCAAIRARG